MADVSVAQRLADVGRHLARSLGLSLLLLVSGAVPLLPGVNLAWDPVVNPARRGYMVYYGPTAGTYPVEDRRRQYDDVHGHGLDGGSDLPLCGDGVRRGACGKWLLQ